MISKFIVLLCSMTALATSLGFAYFFLSPSHFEIMTKANAQESPEERMQEGTKTNIHGFSPVSPGVSGQVPKQPENMVNLNLLPQSLIKTGSPLLGTASAPITIVEFGDFQCKFCDRFAKETEQRLIQLIFILARLI